MGKKLFAALAAVGMLFCIYATSADNSACPYDDDYKYVLKKALIDYLKDPKNSKFTLDEVKEMLNFYLINPSTIDADCSQGNIDALLERADSQIPDETLRILKGRKLGKCDICFDGTLCGEKNEKEQTCTCKDIDDDGKSEFCFLKPRRPAKKTCEVCPDGTACGEQNQQNQTCKCKDTNKDGKPEFCFLTPIKPTNKTCEVCPDGTPCDEQNQQNQTCKCKDTNKDGKPEFCFLTPIKPTKTCEVCPDGTPCGEQNQQNQTCKCKDVNKDGKMEYCFLHPLSPPPGPGPCDECWDGTPCDEQNQQGQTCECKDTNKDGKYEYCQLKPRGPECVSEGGTIGYTVSPEGKEEWEKYGKYLKCCEGLTKIDYTIRPDSTGTCKPVDGWSGSICTKCGDGICDLGENKCNCQTDCPETCLSEGQKGPGGPIPTGTTAPECCAGLTKLKADYDSNCIQAVDGGYTCTYCGNGQCGPGENKCNCLKDCTPQTTTTSISPTTTMPIKTCKSHIECVYKYGLCAMCGSDGTCVIPEDGNCNTNGDCVAKLGSDWECRQNYYNFGGKKCCFPPECADAESDTRGVRGNCAANADCDSGWTCHHIGGDDGGDTKQCCCPPSE